MEVFRLCRKAFASDLSGAGAALKGGRWNSIGVKIIYTSANRSLAMAEVAVHLSLATMPSDYVLMTIHVPDDLSLRNLTTKELPADWNSFPGNALTQKIGDAFVADNKVCGLRIPSAVTQGDFNFLFNPEHGEFQRIKILSFEKFPFDRRIFKG